MGIVIWLTFQKYDVQGNYEVQSNGVLPSLYTQWF